MALRLLIVLALVGPSLAIQAQNRPSVSEAQIQAKIDSLLGTLTLEEKVSLCHGVGTMSIDALPKIGLTERFWMDDGPNNVRADLKDDTFDLLKPDANPSEQSTSLPRLGVLAATWDRDLASQYGRLLGAEARARGKDMMLGPGVNIMRTPLGGRNMEYLSEDPYLTAQLAVPEIEGIQSCDVAACVKHYALNNQELNRMGVDIEVDDRTLHEIYLPVFEAAVKEAGALSIMGAYNRFRGQYCCENDLLLNRILKKQWGFKGFVVSDWGATHDTIPSALAGLDVEMHEGQYIKFFKKPLLEAVKSGQVPPEVLDDKVRRVLYVMLKVHKIDGQPRVAGAINTPEHQALARTVAEAGIVLLKNEKQLLPLDSDKIKTLLLVGNNATDEQCKGGGSCGGNPPYEITPLAGLKNLLGSSVDIESEPLNQPNSASDLKALAERAHTFDAVLFFTGDSLARNEEGEGDDRKSMDLPAGTTEAVKAVVDANPNTVVVNISGSPVAMPWVDQAPTLVQVGYAGMEAGNALAKILFGRVNPSGKLAYTWPKQLSDSPAHALGNYNGEKVIYGEGVFVGYRWFDDKKIDPLFPFGYGQSYTKFELKNLKLSASRIPAGDSVAVTVDVSNTGSRDGAEIVQLYIGDFSAKIARPPHELKGFEKVSLKPGETRNVAFALHPRDFSYWDKETGNWKIDPGTFSVLVGDSSRSLQNRASLEILP